MRIMERRAKQVLNTFQASFTTIMRARVAAEHRVRADKIKTLRGAAKAIDRTLASPGSKAALRGLRASRSRIAKLLEREITELADRKRGSKGVERALRVRPWE